MSWPVPVIYLRDQWTKVTPSETQPLGVPVSHVYYTTTGSNMCFTFISCTKEIDYVTRRDLRAFNDHSRSPSKKRDLYYNFLIGADGAIYDARGWDMRPIMPDIYRNYAKKCILIAYIGRFCNYPPSNKMFVARDAILSYGLNNGYISEQFKEVNIEY